MKKFLSPAVFILTTLGAWAARAADLGIAKEWQFGFQAPATPVMQKLYDLHDFLLVVITVISAFVLLLLVYICLRYHHKRHPVASKTAHNTRLEIIWTTIPILILVVIAIPSLRLHYYMQRDIDPQLTVKVTGYQWYWHYDYPDNGGFGYDSYLKKDSDIRPGEHRQLTVDNAMVVPVNTRVRVLITGADVIHSWSVPAFGVKRDAVPGRLNGTWFEAEKTGTFYGQCSQLCGVGHGYMPIEVHVVSQSDYSDWVKQQQKKTGVSPAASAPAATPAAPAVTQTPTTPAPPPASAQKAAPAPTPTPTPKPAATPTPTPSPTPTPTAKPAARPAPAPAREEKKPAPRPPKPAKKQRPALPQDNGNAQNAPPPANNAPVNSGSDDITYPDNASFPDFKIRR